MFFRVRREGRYRRVRVRAKHCHYCGTLLPAVGLRRFACWYLKAKYCTGVACKSGARKGIRRWDLWKGGKEARGVNSHWKHLKVTFNGAPMTEDVYHDLFLKQDGKCAICGERKKRVGLRRGSRRGLMTDHNHKSGAVRGLLCNRCNGSLGWVEKHQERILAYLGGSNNSV